MDVFTDSAVAAGFTAVHLAMAILRRHRTSGTRVLNPYVALSFAFVPTPWLWPSAIGIAVMLGAHGIWFLVCEVLAPHPTPPVSARTASAPPKNRPSTKAPRTASPASPARSPGFEQVPVLAVLDEAPEIKTFRLGRPSHFDFTAGQFVAVRVHIDGKPHVRCYSISSAPETRGYLEISVRRQGLVSRTLHASCRAGSLLSLGQPAGQFVYPANDDRPVALVAGGIGITPLLSMLRHAVTSDPTRPVTLLYSARSEQDVAFLSELRVVGERHPQVRMALTLTRPTAQTQYRTGRIDTAMVRQCVGDPTQTIFCLCGPPPMLTDMRAVLSGMDVPDSQVRFEQFDTSAAASLLNAPSTSKSSTPEPTGAVASRSDDSVYQVTFSLSGRTAAVDASNTLLDAAEAEGIPIPFSCRAGVCQSCRTRVLQGEIDCRSDVLDPDDREAGFVLPCVSWASADCVLEA